MAHEIYLRIQKIYPNATLCYAAGIEDAGIIIEWGDEEALITPDGDLWEVGFYTLDGYANCIVANIDADSVMVLLDDWTER